MKSSFTKFAIAACVTIAIGAGLYLGLGTTGVALGDVYEKLQQIASMSYKMHMTMTGLPGMPADQTMNMEMDYLLVNDLGMRMNSYTNDKLASTGTMIFSDKTMIILMPESKQYMQITLTDELLDKSKKDSADPRMMVEQFLKDGYTDLGQSEIDGVKVQGFESTNPNLLGGMFTDTITRIWADIRTGYPYRLTMEGVGKGIQEGVRIDMVADTFEWNVPFESDTFSMEIPEGYTLMGDISLKGLGNGEELIDALKFFLELSGDRFPKSLNAMDLSQELIDLGKEGLKPQLTGQEGQGKVMQFTIACTNFQMLSMQNADPKYYGDTVKPGEFDKVLVRWKNENGKYLVIFGDLHTEEVTAERLAELEAQK